MKPANESCADCRFSQSAPDLDSLEGELLFCLRFPPTVEYIQEQGKNASRFPTVKAMWWCGEHKPAPQAKPN